MSKWKVAKFGDIAEFKYGKMPDKDKVSDLGYPIFSGYRIVGYYPEFMCEDKEIIVIARGVGGTGDVKLSPRQSYITNLSIIAFIKNPNVCDKRYLYYQFLCNNLRYLDTGAAQSQITIGSLKKHKIILPDLPTQERIVDILSTYDDLIENNNKRIALLEKAAQELYKEWFVRFRFPSHEATRFVNGLPEEWNRVKLFDLIDFNPTIKRVDSTRYKIIPMAALSTSNMIIDETQVGILERLIGSRSNNGDTLLARITPCLENGKTGFVQCLDDSEVAGGSTEFIVMRSKKLNPYIVYFIARDKAFRDSAIASMNGADGRQRAKPDRLKKLQWLQPPVHIIDAFGEMVSPLFKIIRKLSLQNQNLAKQRDLLLPRLMSGKLEV